MKVFEHISELITLSGAHKKDGRKLVEADLGIIKDGTLVADKNQIHWCGKTSEIPSEYQKLEKINCSTYTILPSWVDAHTHLVYAGNRAHEYSMRLNGASYEEIAKAG